MDIPKYVSELCYWVDGLSETNTEEDPDGADRGGYHQVTESVKIADGTIHYTQTVSDYYEDRMGEEPEPYVESKEDAVSWIRGILEEHEKACKALRQLLEKAEAAADFDTNVGA